jgi:hypothetical protein
VRKSAIRLLEFYSVPEPPHNLPRRKSPRPAAASGMEQAARSARSREMRSPEMRSPEILP